MTRFVTPDGVRRAGDRVNLSKAKPEALWRLARFTRLTNPECHCIPCMTALVRYLAEELESPASD